MTRTWSEWLPHTAGEPFPIPDAKEGEYGVKIGESVLTSSEFYDAIDFQFWDEVTHYRYILPETPSEPVKDWEIVAREWESVAGELADAIHSMNGVFQQHYEPAIDRDYEASSARDAALSTYEAMK